MQATALKRRRFTADEIQQLLDVGFLHEDDPVELLFGELVEMSPQGPAHGNRIASLCRLLFPVMGDSAHLRVQLPLFCDAHSVPEPDFAIVIGSPDALGDRHPRGDETRLVIELAATSQERDRAKAQLYAQAGVLVYWLVDLASHVVEVHEQPDPTGRYRSLRILEGDEKLQVPGTDLVLTADELSR